MKLSVYTLACPEMTFQEAAQQLADLGIEGVEWRVSDVGEDIDFNPFDPGRFWGANRATLPVDDVVHAARDVAKITADYGLETSFVAGGTHPTNLDQIRCEMEAAGILGAPAIRVSPGGGPDISCDAAFDKARMQWDAVEQVAAETGIKAVVETHHQSLVPTSSAARRLMEGRDPANVGVLWDPGNMVFEGHERPEYGLSIIEPWLCHVHVKNARPVVQGAGEHGQLQWGYEWCTLRNGMVNWPAVVETLSDIGYEGYLSLEDFNPATQAEFKLQDFVDFIRPALNADGSAQ